MKCKKKKLSFFLIAVFICSLIVSTILSTFLYMRYNIVKLESFKEEIFSEDFTRERMDQIINSVIKQFKYREIYTIISESLIGAFIIIMASKKIIEPIKNLSKATKEVSNGNFNISLDIKRNDELGELTDNFNKMTKQLKNTEYLQKDFMNNVSHEFKTPVAAIEGFAKLLNSGNLSPEEEKEYLEIIAEESKRLSNLSTNVLKLSKIENEEFKLNLEKFDLSEQIRKSILILENKWSKKNLKLDINLKEIDIIADKELLEQVWINIIGNSIKFSNDNGKISIKLYENNNNVIVEIKDNGVGISKENQERIFERFYQVNKSHSKEGNGLGLPICKKIIELHSGKIECESEENKGTTFRIILNKS